MNNKAQMEIHPLALAMGVLGGVLGVYMANSMMAGTVMKIVIFAVVSIVCFVVSNMIFNKE